MRNARKYCDTELTQQLLGTYVKMVRVPFYD